MNGKSYSLVGNFGFTPGPKGVSVFKYKPDTADFEFVNTFFEDVNAGHQYVDEERNIVYLVNECGSRREELGGGGYVMALRFDTETGELSLINEKESLAPSPSFFCLDKSKRYALVSHHCDHGFVTKIRKKKGTGFYSETCFDDCALVLFHINEDGSLGEVSDVHITKGNGSKSRHPIAHQHSVVAEPSGELFIVCDKGLDKILTFQLDRINGRIIPKEDLSVEYGLSPRYGTFHPELPIFYENNERKTVINSYGYDVSSGMLKLLDSSVLLKDSEAAEGVGKVEASDIVIHPNGRFLYVSVRGIDCISVFSLDDKGKMTLKENVDAHGAVPRGLSLSPDGRFIFASNMESGSVTGFFIEQDGSLRYTGIKAETSTPGNMVFFYSQRGLGVGYDRINDNSEKQFIKRPCRAFPSSAGSGLWRGSRGILRK